MQYQEQKDSKQKNSKNHHYFSSYFKSVAQTKYNSYQPICRDQDQMGYSNDNERKTPDSAAWTMVYDEGFEVRVKNLRLFAFQYYFPHVNKTNKYSSNCSRTCVGWYREEGGDVGCFWAEMVNRNRSVNYISEQNDQLLVVERGGGEGGGKKEGRGERKREEGGGGKEEEGMEDGRGGRNEKRGGWRRRER